MRVAILGAGGLAREALAVPRPWSSAGGTSRPSASSTSPSRRDTGRGLPVLGDESWFGTPTARGRRRRARDRQSAHSSALGVGGGAIRRHFRVARSPDVPRPRVRVAQGCLMLPMSSLTTDMTIHDFVSINPDARSVTSRSGVSRTSRPAPGSPVTSASARGSIWEPGPSCCPVCRSARLGPRGGRRGRARRRARGDSGRRSRSAPLPERARDGRTIDAAEGARAEGADQRLRRQWRDREGVLAAPDRVGAVGG